MKLSKEQIKQFYEKNKKVILGGGAAVIVAIILIIVGVTGSGEEEPVAEDKEPELTEEEIAAENWALMTNDLEKDAYPEVNALVESYFTSMAEGDIDAVEAVVVDLQDEEKEQIREKQEYLEEYQNIECYTKKGPEINTYIVFVCYEEKYVDIETPVPSLKPLYVVATAEELIITDADATAAATESEDESEAEETDAADAADAEAEETDTADAADAEAEDLDTADAADIEAEDAADAESDLNYYIRNSGLDEETIGYINSISGEDDVLELYEQVKDAYAKAIEADETLNKFINKLLKAAGIEDANTAEETADASEEEEKPEETAEASEPEESTDQASADDEADESEADTVSDEEARTKANQGAPGRFVTLSNTVNIRASYNEDAKLIYTAAPGEVLRVEMDYAEGWSKVTVYDNGKVGYVKTMYLE